MYQFLLIKQLDDFNLLKNLVLLYINNLSLILPKTWKINC